eukprot:m51a1_g10847 hypothetical protein (130) ;mRNA; f:40419-40859
MHRRIHALFHRAPRNATVVVHECPRSSSNLPSKEETECPASLPRPEDPPVYPMSDEAGERDACRLSDAEVQSAPLAKHANSSSPCLLAPVRSNPASVALDARVASLLQTPPPSDSFDLATGACAPSSPA